MGVGVAGALPLGAAAHRPAQERRARGRSPSRALRALRRLRGLLLVSSLRHHSHSVRTPRPSLEVLAFPSKRGLAVVESQRCGAPSSTLPHPPASPSDTHYL